MTRIFLIFFYLYAQLTFAATLSPSEQKIRDHIINHKQAQIVLLEKLVNINSGTTNPNGVHKVGEIMRREFKQLGFTTRWVEEPATMHRAGTLIAEHHGKRGKRLLLIGHLDTVFAKDSPFRHIELQNHIAKGPGTLDDKGGMVVMLFALQALHENHALDDTTITVVLTGDEEDSGKPTYISRKPLLDAANKMEIALDFEPTLSLSTATIARRGITDWTVTTHGNESHSATIFQKNVGAGAIFELARILNTMRTALVGIKDVTFNPGIVLAGTQITYDPAASQGTAFGKQNVVAKIALARGDLRYLTVNQKKSLEAKMTAIVGQHLEGKKSTISFQDGIPAMQPTAQNLELLKQYSRASIDLGHGEIKPLEPGSRGAGDISYVASIVPADLAGLGPVGLGAHSIIEALELDSLPVQTERAAVFIYRLTR